MLDFLSYSFYGCAVGNMIMAIVLVAYVIFLFRICKPGSLRITRSANDGLRGSLRITRPTDSGTGGSTRTNSSPLDDKKD